MSYEVCTNCPTRLVDDDAIYINDEPYCEECFDNEDQYSDSELKDLEAHYRPLYEGEKLAGLIK